MALGLAITAFQTGAKFYAPITGFGALHPYALSSDGTALTVDPVRVNRETIGYVLSGSLDVFRTVGTPTITLKDGLNDATVSATVQTGIVTIPLGIAGGSFTAGVYSWLLLVGVTGPFPAAYSDDGTALTTRLTRYGWIVGGFFESAGSKTITLVDKNVSVGAVVTAVAGGIPIRALTFNDNTPLQFSDGQYLELAA